MRRQVAIVMCSMILALMTVSSHSIAQQKTAKACREEWQANKAANQANGITEKAYVSQCRTGAAPAQTTAAPPAPATAAPAAAPATAVTGQKTAKACREEWQANKAANQANGITEKAYVTQCRTGAAPAQNTAAPPAPAPTAAPAPAPSAAAPPARPSPPAAAQPSPNASAKTAAANEFSTEPQAKAHCPADTVVWANLTSKVYHFSGTRFYGETKNGVYMCERDSVAGGMRAAKNETHP
jgi:hypothetical protein